MGSHLTLIQAGTRLGVAVMLAAAPASIGFAQRSVQAVQKPAADPAEASVPARSPGLGIYPQPQAPQAEKPVQGPPEPAVAEVEGHTIGLSELGAAIAALPEDMQGLPFETLYPVLVERMVDHRALVMMAVRAGLETRPDVVQQVQQATERVLESAWLAQDALPKVTEEAIRARYTRIYANRRPSEEVRARHILLTTEEEARKVLQDLRNGADFITIARVSSKDPDGARGGDLGFFRREQVWPALADVAFSVPPGQLAPEPIKNEFGWHVVKIEEKRLVAPPTYAEAHDQLQQELLTDAVQQAVERARRQLTIHQYNIDGTTLDTGPKLKVGSPGTPDAEQSSQGDR